MKGNPPEGQKEKSKREMLVERMRSRYPDANFDDDDEFYGAVGTDYDNYEKELGDMKNEQKEFTDMFANDPRTAYVFQAFKKDSKKHPLVVLTEMFGPEFRDALENPEAIEGLAEAEQEFSERMVKSDKLEKEYNENIKKSFDVFDKMEADGVDEKTISDAVNFVTSIANDVILGKFSEETMQMAIKAINHDADVSEAAHIGEVKGRNAKIDEKLRKSKSGDGTAQLGGANNVPMEKPKKDLGALERVSERKSIWD